MQPWSWLYAVCFLDLLGASMIMPVFSSHLRSLNISHFSIGILSSLYGITQFVSGPLVGSWSDINGRRPILCLSMVVCCVAYALMGFISSFYLFVVIRCILGTLKHTQTLCRAFVADIIPSEKQVSAQGVMNALTSLGFMIGPVIGGHIMETTNGFQFLTSVVSLIFILNTTLVFIFGNTNHNINKKHQAQNNVFSKKIVLVFRQLIDLEWNKFWMIFSLKFLFALAGILFFQNMSLILTEYFLVSPREMGYTISFYGFVSTVCNLLLGRIKSLNMFQNTYMKNLTYTFFVMATTFYFLYNVRSYPLYVMGIIPLSASHALARIFLMEVLLEQSDEEIRGSIVGSASSLTSVVRIFAPFLSGLIISFGNVFSVLLVSAVIATCACVLTVT